MRIFKFYILTLIILKTKSHIFLGFIWLKEDINRKSNKKNKFLIKKS